MERVISQGKLNLTDYQMDYSKALSKEELEEYNRVLSTQPADDKTRDACLRYYADFKAASGPVSPDKISTTIKCAFFVAEKTQVLFDVKGQRIRGIGLSLKELMKNNQQFDVFAVLKDFLKKVVLEDQEAATELNHMMKTINFLISFHDKFDKTIQKMDYHRDKSPEMTQYIKSFTSLAWLFFAMTRKEKAFTCDPIENTFLMGCIVSFFVVYAWDYAKPKEFADYKFSDKREISLVVQKHLLPTYFNINNCYMKTYQDISDLFNDNFALLTNKGYIKMTSGKEDFMSPKYIESNVKRVDHLYQSRLTPEDLDERIFMKERAANLTPSRFTPFARQGYVNKLSKPGGSSRDQPSKNFNSHRILNYDMLDKIENTIPISQPLNEIRIPKNVINSPQMFKPKLICSTPITAGMEMYNFLNQKSKKAKDANFPQRAFDQTALELISQVLDCTDKKNEKTKEIKSNLIFSLYKVATEDYMSQYPQFKEDEELMRSFLTVCTELVFFVSNISMSFEEIEEVMDSSKIDEWKACDFFMRFDKSIPPTLKLRILDMEVNLISYKVWKEPVFISTIQQLANNRSDVNQGEHMERCFKRILHQLAFQTNQLCMALQLDDYMADLVFETLKLILSQFSKMMEGRHLDQLLICAVYIICKKEEVEIKFMEIKDKYETTNPNNKPLHEEIICRVNMGPGNDPQDIIKFYNKIFRNSVAHFLESIAVSENNSHQINNANKNLTTAQILQSPLRSILPKEMGLHRMQNGTKGNQTPNATKLLYALNQSPLMKFQASFKQRDAVQSKKAINFDLQEKNFMNIVKPSEPPIADGMQQASKYLKKFANRLTPTISKHGSEKMLFPQQLKTNYQKGHFDRK